MLTMSEVGTQKSASSLGPGLEVYGSRSTWTSKVPKTMAQYLNIESVGSIGSIMLVFLEVQADWCRVSGLGSLS